MHRTLTRMALEPIADTLAVESAETFETRHADTNLKFLETDCAFSIIYTVLLCCCVREHAREALMRTTR